MTAAPADAASVAAVRSFIRSRRPRRWLDLYATGFAVVLVVVFLSDFLARPFSRLTASPGGSPPAQAAAGFSLVIGAAAGLLVLAQAFGPLVLSPADASWLLLSPLDRRRLLRRPALVASALSVLAGGLLGVLALAMAGPYLRQGAHSMPWAWLLLAAVTGAGFFLAAVGGSMLAQPYDRGRSRLRAAWVAVSAAAMLGGVTAERWIATSGALTARFAGISSGAFAALAAVALAAACAVALLVWRMTRRFPAAVLRSDSARAGTTRTAAAFLNLPLLTWIAEDNHWRGRLLASRPWPRLSPAFALAWADWRRLARRPVSLTVLAGSTLAPALAGAAITGRARGFAVAAALLAGAIAAGTQGATATRRDANDPALRRLLGVDARAALAARAALPALLSSAWMTLALALLAAFGVLPGWFWPLLGPVAGPGAAAATLRIARTAPVNPSDQGIETPLGPVPSWLITRSISVLIGLAGCYPALKAVVAGQVHGSTFAAQLAVSAAVLGGYLVLTAPSPQAPRATQ